MWHIICSWENLSCLLLLAQRELFQFYSTRPSSHPIRLLVKVSIFLSVLEFAILSNSLGILDWSSVLNEKLVALKWAKVQVFDWNFSANVTISNVTLQLTSKEYNVIIWYAECTEQYININFRLIAPAAREKEHQQQRHQQHLSVPIPVLHVQIDRVVGSWNSTKLHEP